MEPENIDDYVTIVTQNDNFPDHYLDTHHAGYYLDLEFGPDEEKTSDDIITYISPKGDNGEIAHFVVPNTVPYINKLEAYRSRYLHLKSNKMCAKVKNANH